MLYYSLRSKPDLMRTRIDPTKRVRNSNGDVEGDDDDDDADHDDGRPSRRRSD